MWAAEYALLIRPAGYFVPAGIGCIARFQNTLISSLETTPSPLLSAFQNAASAAFRSSSRVARAYFQLAMGCNIVRKSGGLKHLEGHAEGFEQQK
jgi:hypothetical protein